MKIEDLSYDVFSILERATKRKEDGNKIINGCAGMLFTPDKHLSTHHKIIEVVRSDFASFLDYPPVIGSRKYKEGVLKWIFEEDKKRSKIASLFLFVPPWAEPGLWKSSPRSMPRWMPSASIPI